MMFALTDAFWHQYNTLVRDLAELHIHTIAEAKAFGLEEDKLRRLQLGQKTLAGENWANNLNNPIARWNHGLMAF